MILATIMCLGMCEEIKAAFKYFIFREDCFNEFLNFNFTNKDCITLHKNLYWIIFKTILV